jgi:hypothetical protein
VSTAQYSSVLLINIIVSSDRNNAAENGINISNNNGTNKIIKNSTLNKYHLQKS